MAADFSEEKQLPDFPKLPDSVKERFPELTAWEDEVAEWMKKMAKAVRGLA